jgi:hypothetical protein
MRRSTLLPLLVVAAAGVRPVTAQPAPPGGPPLVFENPSLGASERQQLESAARMVARWAMVQRIVAAVTAQNETAPTSERIAEIDRAWQAGDGVGGLADALLSNDCAQALQAVVVANPGYAEGFVTDQRGALVCATHRPTDYYQGDEDIWRVAFAEGAGAIFVAAPSAEAGSELTVVHISVPVRSAGRTVGVLTVAKLADG